jgi:hypothetical protein
MFAQFGARQKTTRCAWSALIVFAQVLQRFSARSSRVMVLSTAGSGAAGDSVGLSTQPTPSPWVVHFHRRVSPLRSSSPVPRTMIPQHLRWHRSPHPCSSHVGAPACCGPLLMVFVHCAHLIVSADSVHIRFPFTVDRHAFRRAFFGSWLGGNGPGFHSTSPAWWSSEAGMMIAEPWTSATATRTTCSS